MAVAESAVCVISDRDALTPKVLCRSLERSRAFLCRALALGVVKSKVGWRSSPGVSQCLGGRAGILLPKHPSYPPGIYQAHFLCNVLLVPLSCL